MVTITKSKNKFFIFIFLSIFLISFISAQQPLSVQTNININTGLQIEFTQILLFENSEDHIFNIHVFNISTGKKVTNDTTECFFHLFDNKGFHIINQLSMPFDLVGVDWDLNVTGGNFTRSGLYSSLVVCSTNDLGGFTSVGFDVTESGAIIGEGEGIILFGLILILILTTIFFLIAAMYIQNLPFKIFLGSLSVLMLISTIGFGVTIMQQLFGIFTNIVSGYSLFFRLFIILLGGAGIGLVLFLVVFALKMFNKSRGLIE